MFLAVFLRIRCLCMFIWQKLHRYTHIRPCNRVSFSVFHFFTFDICISAFCQTENFIIVIKNYFNNYFLLPIHPPLHPDKTRIHLFQKSKCQKWKTGKVTILMPSDFSSVHSKDSFVIYSTDIQKVTLFCTITLHFMQEIFADAVFSL